MKIGTCVRALLCIWALLTISVPLTVQAQSAQGKVPRFEPVECPGVLRDRTDFTCGFLIVPEDHALPEGKTIRLMVATAHSLSPEPEPDPVVLLSGGPGSGAVGSTGDSLYERTIRERRNLIFLDQRGTGHSQPSLDCPELDNLSLLILSQPQVPAADLIHPLLKACRDRLVSAGIKLEAYTSAQNAADVESLRQALGYPQINLWGGSYGTRLALTVMRDFPAGVRSAVLDSVYPPHVEMYRDAPGNADHTFSVLFDRCAADLLCNLFYPKLRTAFLDVYAQLDKQPVKLDLTIPSANQQIDYYLTADGFAAGVFQFLYDPHAIRYLPSLIYGLRDGDLKQVTAAVNATAQISNALSFGMFFSVMCSEEAPFSTLDEMSAVAQNYPSAMQMHGSIFSAEMWALCQVLFPAGITPDPRENEVVQSDVPALILAGEHDPVTPPVWGKQTADNLSNSYYLEFPGLGHGVVGVGASCPILIAVEFVNHPERRPSSACIGEMRGVAFVVTAAATRPYAVVLSLALGGIAGGAVILTARAAWTRRRGFAWKVSRRLVTWLPTVTAAITMGLLLVTKTEPSDKLRIAELIIPAALAVQVALAVAPTEDRTLEVIATCPRPVWWLPLERAALPAAAGTVLALGASLIAIMIVGQMPVRTFLLHLLRWIPPTLMFSGIALYVSIRTRQIALGALGTFLIWGTAAIAGKFLLPGYPTFFPLNYLQPLLWVFHPYLQPGELTSTDYLLNRVVVASVGVVLIIWIIRRMRNTEWLIFGNVSRPFQANSHQGVG